MVNNPFTKGGSIHRLWQRSAGFRRYLALDRAINKLVSNGADSKAAATATDLFKHWGTPLDQAGESYVRSCLAELEGCKGSVLMSGSSALTLVVSAACHNERSRKFFCFEQNKDWAQVIRTWIKQYEINNTYVMSAASVLTSRKKIPTGFGLVFCEGSNGTTTSPVAALEQFSGHLLPSFTMLARRVNVEKDGPLMMHWAREHDASFVIINKQDGFVKIFRDSERKEQPKGRVSFELADIAHAATSQEALPAKAAAG